MKYILKKFLIIILISSFSIFIYKIYEELKKETKETELYGTKLVAESNENIVSEKHWPWPDTEHYSFHSADLVALIQIAYDTIGSSHFKGRGVESWDSDEIDELEAEYEARRNEV